MSIQVTATFRHQVAARAMVTVQAMVIKITKISRSLVLGAALVLLRRHRWQEVWTPRAVTRVLFSCGC
jgi:hypothetical protein